MSKLRPGFGPSRKEKKANRPLPRIEQENADLEALYEEVGEDLPPEKQVELEIGLAIHAHISEMIRHLQEIEGRTR